MATERKAESVSKETVVPKGPIEVPRIEGVAELMKDDPKVVFSWQEAKSLSA